MTRGTRSATRPEEREAADGAGSNAPTSATPGARPGAGPYDARRMKASTATVRPDLDLAVDTWEPSDVTGVPFLLVHGLASNARLWDGVATRLVECGHTVSAVDLRGHGRSGKPDGPYDVPTVADDLERLISRLALDRPVVAGQSWGGNVVLELAARHPSAVRGVVCVDGGWLEPARAFSDWDECLRVLAPPRLVGRRFADVEAHVRAAHPDWPEPGIRGTLANFEVRPDGTIAPWLTYERHVAVLRGLWEHRPSELYERIRVPVLLLPVDGDRRQPPDRKRSDVEAAAQRIPVSRVHWFSGDHDIHAQRPLEVADVLHSATVDGFFV